MKERLISFIRFANNRNLEYFRFIGHLYVSNLETEFYEYLNINVFKHEESDKASVDSTHTQGACGEESIDSPAVSVSHFPTIDAEYVFVSSNTIIIFKIALMNDYHINNQEIN